MSSRFITVSMDDGSRWHFNLDQLVKVRVSGDPPKVSVEVSTGKSFALDRQASADFLKEFERCLGGEALSD